MQAHLSTTTGDACLFIGGFLALLLRYEAQVNDLHTHTHTKVASGRSVPLVVIDEKQVQIMQSQQQGDKEEQQQQQRHHQKLQSRPTNKSGGLFKERVRERPWSSNVPTIDHLLLSPESRARNDHTTTTSTNTTKVTDCSSSSSSIDAITNASSSSFRSTGFAASKTRGEGRREERSIGTASGTKSSSSRGSRGGAGGGGLRPLTTSPKPQIAVSAWGDLENLPNERGVTWALPPIPTQHAICSSRRGMVECVRAGLFAWREFDARGVTRRRGQEGSGVEESGYRCPYFDFLHD